MAKTNKFSVKEFEENKITVEEERKDRSPLALFFKKNGKLIFAISFLFSIAVFIIAIALTISNIDDSYIVKYEDNGVIVTFDETDNSIINGTPITEDYAGKVFDSVINAQTSSVGVVVKIDEISEHVLKDRSIVFYSDKTALIKYNNGGYMWVSSVNGDFGVTKKGVINRNAITKKLNGTLVENTDLGISMLYLSDGSIEVTSGDDVFFVRNGDITNNDQMFYTNLSGVSLPIKRDNGDVYYSDGTIKKANYIIVDGKEYKFIEKKNVYGNIKVLYYENGYAEVVNDALSVMVKKSDHIVYDDNILEIIDNSIISGDIKDIMDIKNITLENTNNETSHYIVVLEETDNYEKHNVAKRLDNKFIRFSTYVNGKREYNNVLNNNLKGSDMLEGLSLQNNTYLLYEGTIERLSEASIKIGMWIDYEDITNEYMGSSFIGTVKVYVESLS